MPFANFLFSLSYNKPKVPRILWDIDCQEMLSVSFWGKANTFTRRLQHANGQGLKNMQSRRHLEMRKDLRIEKSRCKAIFFRVTSIS